MAILLLVTSFVASAQCSTLQYKVDNSTSCTYTLTITYINCSSSSQSTGLLTANANQSNYYFIPCCCYVTHVRVYDALNGGNNADVDDGTSAGTWDDVGDCNIGSTVDNVDWIDGQTTYISP